MEKKSNIRRYPIINLKQCPVGALKRPVGDKSLNIQKKDVIL